MISRFLDSLFDLDPGCSSPGYNIIGIFLDHWDHFGRSAGTAADLVFETVIIAGIVAGRDHYGAVRL